MTFNPEKQYRCAIVRGRAKGMMDDLLSAYMRIIESICPCSKEEFAREFDAKIRQFLGRSDKSIANHRTEIAGRLFGMYYFDENDVVQISEKTKQLLEDQDQPAFFKDVCAKLQFPSGMNKPNPTVRDHVKLGIKIRQGAFLLKTLQLANTAGMELTKDELGYYVLNALEVLQGKITPDQVLSEIQDRRKKHVIKKVADESGRKGSKSNQHITETFNYLELANLIKVEGRLVKTVTLNLKEEKSIMSIADQWDKPLPFCVEKYDLNTRNGARRLSDDWLIYAGQLSHETAITYRTDLQTFSEKAAEGIGFLPGDEATEIGDQAEAFVFNYERKRIKNYSARMAMQVIHFGKTKGLGFDIQSLFAEKGSNPEHAIFIEVKGTKRVTAPDPSLVSWNDTVTLTRREWTAAEQYKEAYFIYRVYFTPDVIRIFEISDPADKKTRSKIKVSALSYRVDFDKSSGSFIKDAEQPGYGA